ncbi:MAG TPA: hypothetical protein VKB81_17345 [Nitrospira sp.]|nr:hypothetical protein [Nitrospira sp.]
MTSSSEVSITVNWAEPESEFLKRVVQAAIHAYRHHAEKSVIVKDDRSPGNNAGEQELAKA